MIHSMLTELDDYMGVDKPIKTEMIFDGNSITILFFRDEDDKHPYARIMIQHSDGELLNTVWEVNDMDRDKHTWEWAIPLNTIPKDDLKTEW